MNKKILLIEDEDYIRQIYKDQIDSAGFSTDAFATGGEGLAAFKKNQYDLVVLDIILPDFNGLKILEEMKKDELKKDIPVLILSNADQDIIIKQGLGLGAEDYLLKVKSTPDMITDKIKSIIDKKNEII
ncbi:response regulator [Candidatus Roizmanbacteria bacterium]|nr:response regulator [Candidatus Roizmanbacteria bacterium]